ncbi:zinc-ribbon domain-containing protein [Croceibacterium sp. TMG7-5b_MA50]|uniref:zinc-ribbon domain-containing protein n=1 Tax=Croceibacterium sp. TMG7-5b_MA50 TaxID=3121290 RepID=UPI003221B72B
MMIECPACATRYQVSETAIPDEGRTVRCAKCGESWFQPRPEPEVETAVEEIAPVDPVDDVEAPPEPVPAPVPPRDRSGRRRLWAWTAIILLALGGASFAAVKWWGAPDWLPLPRATFAAGKPGLELDFPPDRQEWQQLPDGTEFFGASGTITNRTDSTADVPPILIVLRDARDRIVYSWEVAPPRRRLAPGQSVAVREAVTDVPRSARVAEIGWKPV